MINNSRFNKSIALFVYIFLNSKAFKIPPLFLMTEEELKELWNPVIKVRMPEKGYYWNNKHGKMIAIAKMAVAFVTGKTMDDVIK